MPRTKRERRPSLGAVWRAGLYTRLSREDGDKLESDSILNQRAMLEAYVSNHPDLKAEEVYTDDGFTGTNFERPDFKRMVADIESGRINCIIVKDLSRFGRDYIGMGQYLERWLPEHDVRFIAIGDNIDNANGAYDMLLPVKNVFNEQYARDISRKVKSAFQTKQRQGEFVGAFASYGYRKDPQDHNKLVIDPCAAPVVQRVFNLFEQGTGKIKIAKILNEEGIPCPSEYKRLNGERYNNGSRIQSTTYWTYATIHRMLQNQMYAGNMEQGRSVRQTMHGKARRLDRSQWTIVEGTHEAIISPEQWDRVQTLLGTNTRILNFEQNVSPFAGFLRCGDCGRAMSKTNHSSGVYYCCGSYKRYGPSACSLHRISHQELESLVLDDLNQIVHTAKNLKELALQAAPDTGNCHNLQSERERCQAALDRLYRLKKSAYEDYKDGLLDRQDFLKYKADYERQEGQLTSQLDLLNQPQAENDILQKPWVEQLLKHGVLTELDRATIAETVEQILIFEDGHLEITYKFSDDMGIWTAQAGDG